MGALIWTPQAGDNGADLPLPQVEAGTLVTIDLTFVEGTAPGNNATTGRQVHIVYLPDPSPDFAGDPFRPFMDAPGAGDGTDGRGREYWVDLPAIWCPYKGQLRLRGGSVGTTWSVAQTRMRCRRKPRDLVHRFSYFAVPNGTAIVIPRGAWQYQTNATAATHALQRDGGSVQIDGEQGLSGTVGPWTRIDPNYTETVQLNSNPVTLNVGLQSVVFTLCIGPDEVDLDAWRAMASPWRQPFPVDPEAVGLLPDTLGYDPSLPGP